MQNCSRRSISIISLIITVLIFIQINYITLKIMSFSQVKEVNSQSIQAEKINKQIINTQEVQTAKEEQWNLIIPKINIKATICEGTGQNILINYVGHFTRNTKGGWKYRSNWKQ